MTAAPDAARVLYEPAVPQKRRILRSLPLLGAVLLLSSSLAALSRLGGDEPGAPAPMAAPAAATAPRPVGSRTESGAVSAAVEFLQAYGSPAMYDPEQRRQVIADITSPALRDQVQREVDAAFTLAASTLGLDGQGRSPDGELVARTIPVGSHTLAFTEDRAVVSVWATGLLGIAGLGSRVPVQETWSTETVTLEWTPGGWRWVSLEHADGPAPIGSPQVPADADVISEAAERFTEVSHAG